MNIVSVGRFYYYVFDLQNASIQFVSPEITEVMGYEPEQFTPEFYIQILHPDDVRALINYGKKVVEFFNAIAPADILSYKVRFDFRLLKITGEYIRVLQQVVILQTTDNGGVNRMLGIHTDISHIKNEGNPVLSFVGMEGRPSYLNVDLSSEFIPTTEFLTRREKEVLYYIVHGRHSNEIAEILFLSKHTVLNHRRNIMAKTQTSTIAELIAKTIQEGWV